MSGASFRGSNGNGAEAWSGTGAGFASPGMSSLRVKSTTTVKNTFTGWPPLRAGLYFHFLTASRAASSSSGIDRSTLKFWTSPFLSMMASRITFPWMRALRAATG